MSLSGLHALQKAVPRSEDPWVILWLCASWLQGVDGSELVYGPGTADAAGGLMEASYRNLQEARVVLQAAHALITAGRAAHR